MITNQEVHADASAAGLASLVPEQLLAHPPHTPEQRLMAAVLEDALRELVRPGGAWYGARARRRAEVQVWLESDDIAWPFSFVNVCEALDLDPGEVRCRVWRPTRGAHRPVRRGCPRRA
jgi:hypothetical protein